ncbi:MAG: dicarboxylate/amino acid:cation symporter, partial [Spirochaetia bacterium]|nr:dicarboxylate/amino acid:cation symporter [Spirochaetia bacterium]
VFFISIIALQFLKIDLYGAEMTLVAMMPILNGMGILIDSYIAAFGATYTCHRMGVLVESSYSDVL